jgi:hypothetical protein
VNLFGVLFVRNGAELDYGVINHEKIHTAQMKELLYIGFYLLYVLEWVYNLMKYGNGRTAYKMISFELEAYEYENDILYLQNRKRYAQWK